MAASSASAAVSLAATMRERALTRNAQLARTGSLLQHLQSTLCQRQAQFAKVALQHCAHGG
jgi:hypothetical protein